MPLGCLLSFFGLVAMYFIEKLNVINYYRRPEKIDGQITLEYVKLFRYVIFIYAIGVYIFLKDVQIQGDYQYWHTLGICIFGGLCLLDIPSIIENLNFFRLAGVNPYKYEDLFFEMGKTYEMQNPVTHNKGFEVYLDKLKERGIINEKEYNEYQEKVISAPSDIIELYYKKKFEKKTTKKKTNLLMKKLLKSTESVSITDKSNKNSNPYLKSNSKGGFKSNFGKGLLKNQINNDDPMDNPDLKEEETKKKNPFKGFLGGLKNSSPKAENENNNTVHPETPIPIEKRVTENDMDDVKKASSFGNNFEPIQEQLEDINSKYPSINKPYYD